MNWLKSLEDKWLEVFWMIFIVTTQAKIIAGKGVTPNIPRQQRSQFIPKLRMMSKPAKTTPKRRGCRR